MSDASASATTRAIMPAAAPETKPAAPKPVVEDRAVAVPHDPYQGIASRRVTKEQEAILTEPPADGDVEIRPDGIVYLPEMQYRRTLNRAFGPGGWAMRPRGAIVMQDNTMSQPWGLWAEGRFISEARGEQEYQPDNGNMSYATASEAVKSNALMRCCKDLCIASELWTPSWIDGWKKRMAVAVWRRGSPKPAWRRKDRDPFYDETGLVSDSKPKPSVAAPEPVKRVDVLRDPAPPAREPGEEDDGPPTSVIDAAYDAANGLSAPRVVERVVGVNGKPNKGGYYGIKLADTGWYSVKDKIHLDTARWAQDGEHRLIVEYEQNGNFRTATSVKVET